MHRILEHKIDRRTLTLGVVFTAIGVIMAVVFRASPSVGLHYTYNALLAIGLGFIGSFIPGAIGVETDFRGMVIRAAGGLAVFVLVFLGFFFLRA
jgi:hypothetical protein